MPLSRTFAHLQNSGGRKIAGSLAVGANLRDKAVVNGKQYIRAKYVRVGLLNGAALRRTDHESADKNLPQRCMGH